MVQTKNFPGFDIGKARLLRPGGRRMSISAGSCGGGLCANEPDSVALRRHGAHQVGERGVLMRLFGRRGITRRADMSMASYAFSITRPLRAQTYCETWRSRVAILDSIF